MGHTKATVKKLTTPKRHRKARHQTRSIKRNK